MKNILTKRVQQLWKVAIVVAGGVTTVLTLLFMLLPGLRPANPSSTVSANLSDVSIQPESFGDYLTNSSSPQQAQRRGDSARPGYTISYQETLVGFQGTLCRIVPDIYQISGDRRVTLSPSDQQRVWAPSFRPRAQNESLNRTDWIPSLNNGQYVVRLKAICTPRHSIPMVVAEASTKLRVVNGTILFFTRPGTAGLISGMWWNIAGVAPQKYRAGATTSHVVFLSSNTATPETWGSTVAGLSAKPYRMQHLRVQGEIRTANVVKGAGFWVRIDGPQDHTEWIDNMYDRMLRGDNGWTLFSIVLPVPKDAIYVVFGLLLNGSGEVQARQLRFSKVAEDVPVTGRHV